MEGRAFVTGHRGCGAVWDAGKRGQLDRDSGMDEVQRKAAEKTPGIAQRDGIARHDRAGVESIKPEKFQELLGVRRELLSKDEGRKLKTIPAVDGKTIRGNGNKN